MAYWQKKEKSHWQSWRVCATADLFYGVLHTKMRMEYFDATPYTTGGRGYWYKQNQRYHAHITFQPLWRWLHLHAPPWATVAGTRSRGGTIRHDCPDEVRFQISMSSSMFCGVMTLNAASGYAEANASGHFTLDLRMFHLNSKARSRPSSSSM